VIGSFSQQPPRLDRSLKNFRPMPFWFIAPPMNSGWGRLIAGEPGRRTQGSTRIVDGRRQNLEASASRVEIIKT